MLHSVHRAMFIGLIATIGVSACQPAEYKKKTQSVAEEDRDAARLISKQLGDKLKAELIAAMSADGPIGAIAVCNEKAPKIAVELNTNQDFQVRRTALKVRNPSNIADPWEQRILLDFQERLEASEDASSMEYSEIVETTTGPKMRWMKPILMGGVCSTCHGVELSPEVGTLIKELYPNDEAIGFEVGDLRGAFSVIRELD